MNESLKQLIKEVNQATGRTEILGSPGEKVTPTPMAEIPEVLRPFWTYVRRAWELGYPPEHTVDSVYCKITTIVPGKEWRLGFEDRDERWGYAPDWDYDEPLLRVRKLDDTLEVTIEKYGGRANVDVYYGDTRLWERVGGFLGRYVGETKTVTTAAAPPVFTCAYCGATFATLAALEAHMKSEHPGAPPVEAYTCPYCGATFGSQAALNAHIASVHPAVPTPPPPPTPTPSPVVESLKKYWPMMIGLALFGGTIAIVGRKK